MVHWQNKVVQIRTQLNIVSEKKSEIYGSPQKPKKPKNYVLTKPKTPSDIEWLIIIYAYNPWNIISYYLNDWYDCFKAMHGPINDIWLGFSEF